MIDPRPAPVVDADPCQRRQRAANEARHPHRRMPIPAAATRGHAAIRRRARPSSSSCALLLRCPTPRMRGAACGGAQRRSAFRRDDDVRARWLATLARSLRDDGPLPDTITDMNKAQDAYAEQLRGAGVVLCLGSMLHSIATGNMLPSWVKIVCVDINPAVATKVSDRGTGQALGVVTDVGQFLHTLADALEEKSK